jgi:cation diffusion facilitator CzcD-associated flavoprotein CzcO
MVIVIGSGATAATLVPNDRQGCGARNHAAALADLFHPGRNANDICRQLRALQVDETWIHEITAARSCSTQDEFTAPLGRGPEAVKAELLAAVKLFLGEGLRHRNALHAEIPALAPAHRVHPGRRPVQGHRLGQGSPSSPTRSRRFTEKGILLKSGKELEADIIVTATGFDLSCRWAISPSTIDGKPLNFADTSPIAA